MIQKLWTNMKISRKIAVTHALLFIALQVLLGVMLLYAIRIYYHYEAVREVDSLVSNIAAKLLQWDELSESSAKQAIPQIPRKHTATVLITDAKGNPVLVYGEQKTEVPPGAPFDRVLQINEPGSHLVYENHLVVREGHTIALIQVVLDIEAHLEFNTLLLRILAVISLVGFCISIFTGTIVSKVVLRPLSRITDTARTISTKNLGSRIAVGDSKDELSELSDVLNGMFQRISESYEQQKRFVADASHELRTPIAVIKGYSDMLDRWGKKDAAVLDESIKAIQSETEHMAGMIEQLLMIARSDNGTLDLVMEPFRLDQLIDEVMLETRMLERGHRLICKENVKMTVNADRKWIKQLLRILLDNSIKYTDAQGSITIASESAGDFAQVTVEDTGTGIPKEELDMVFDRFHRVGGTREKGGNGLGLAIAKSIIDAHEGNIEISSKVGKGTKVKFLIYF